MDVDEEEGSLNLLSEYIRGSLKNIPVAVLMGANIADEVARGEFCESTLGCFPQDIPKMGELWRTLFNRPTFQVAICEALPAVELCGALKNIVALGAGFVDGLGLGANTKAAIIRLGLLEMEAFCHLHGRSIDVHEEGSKEKDGKLPPLLHSCGIADLITTCYGGRNRRVAEALVRTGKPLNVLEDEMLNGQKLQGPPACKAVYRWLAKKDLLGKFTLFSAIYDVCFEGAEPSSLLRRLEEGCNTKRADPSYVKSKI